MTNIRKISFFLILMMLIGSLFLIVQCGDDDDGIPIPTTTEITTTTTPIVNPTTTTPTTPGQTTTTPEPTTTTTPLCPVDDGAWGPLDIINDDPSSYFANAYDLGTLVNGTPVSYSNETFCRGGRHPDFGNDNQIYEYQEDIDVYKVVIGTNTSQINISVTWSGTDVTCGVGYFNPQVNQDYDLAWLNTAGQVELTRDREVYVDDTYYFFVMADQGPDDNPYTFTITGTEPPPCGTEVEPNNCSSPNPIPMTSGVGQISGIIAPSYDMDVWSITPGMNAIKLDITTDICSSCTLTTTMNAILWAEGDCGSTSNFEKVIEFRCGDPISSDIAVSPGNTYYLGIWGGGLEANRGWIDYQIDINEWIFTSGCAAAGDYYEANEAGNACISSSSFTITNAEATGLTIYSTNSVTIGGCFHDEGSSAGTLGWSSYDSYAITGGAGLKMNVTVGYTNPSILETLFILTPNGTSGYMINPYNGTTLSSGIANGTNMYLLMCGAGSPIADGNYTLTITATEACDSTITSVGPGTIINVPPSSLDRDLFIASCYDSNYTNGNDHTFCYVPGAGITSIDITTDTAYNNVGTNHPDNWGADTILMIGTVPGMGDLGCHDDIDFNGGIYTSELLNIPVTPGEEYYITIDTYGQSDQSPYDMTLVE
jgi:hypothetical protein